MSVKASGTAAAVQMAEWATGLHVDDIPERVRRDALLHVLDALGTGLAALALGEVPAARAVAAELGGPPEAVAIGLDQRLGAPSAAFANGALMHAIDFDDTHETALVHSSAVIAPAMLAAAQATRASGAEALVAAVAAFEISSRIGLSMAGKLHVRGFHPTSVCGVFSAATIGARLRGLDANATRHALGIAGSQASGVMEYLSDGSQTKPYHAGWAAHAGLIAAALAAHGGEGPATVLEGRFGILATHVGDADPGQLLDGLGERWETSAVAYKPYPACHCTHTVLDAVSALQREEGLRAEDVDEVVCRVPSQVAVGLVLEPAERKLHPATVYDAKFSLPFCIGTQLVTGSVGVPSFVPEALGDANVAAIADRVRYVVEPYPDGNDLSGGVTVRTRDGRTLERHVLRARGGPGAPMADEEIQAKFRANAAMLLDDGAVEALESALLGLEQGGVAPVVEVLAGIGAR
jgi:2-methylcitrate dehydratase PrpD